MGCKRGRRCVVEPFIRPSLLHQLLMNHFGLHPIHQTIACNNSVIIDYVDAVPVRFHLFTRSEFGSVTDLSLQFATTVSVH